MKIKNITFLSIFCLLLNIFCFFSVFAEDLPVNIRGRIESIKSSTSCNKKDWDNSEEFACRCCILNALHGK